MTPNTETVDSVAMQGALPCGTTSDRPGGDDRQQESQIRPATDYPVATTSQAEFVTCMVVVAVGLCVAVMGAIAVAHFAEPPLQAPAAVVVGSAAPTRVPSFPRARPADGGGIVPLSIYIQAIDAIWHQESRRGTDPKAARGVVGEHGELGPMQVTPQWRVDVERLTGIRCDPYDMGLLRYQALVYLLHYAPRVGATTVDDMADMYRLGPTGFRRARGPGPRTARHGQPIRAAGTRLLPAQSGAAEKEKP